MSAILEAWLEGRHVGQFVEDGAGRVLFSYDSDAPQTPLSLSLPRDRPAAQKAAANFLSNLLPDEDRVRARMASVQGDSGVCAFDLLEKAGGDIAGGLVLVSEAKHRPSWHPS